VTRLDRVYDVCNTVLDALPNSAIAYGADAATEAIRAGAHRISYVPERHEFNRLPDIVAGHVDLILGRGIPWGFMFHELGDLAPEGKPLPESIAYLWRAGAVSKHVIVACFQSALWLPRIVVRQSNHVFLFAMYDPGDLLRASQFMGPQVRDAPLPLPFDRAYYYRGPDGRLSRVPGVR